MFLYDSRTHIESDSFEDMIAGNAPIIVSRADGSIHETGTAYPIEHYLADFERKTR